MTGVKKTTLRASPRTTHAHDLLPVAGQLLREWRAVHPTVRRGSPHDAGDYLQTTVVTGMFVQRDERDQQIRVRSARPALGIPNRRGVVTPVPVVLAPLEPVPAMLARLIAFRG